MVRRSSYYDRQERIEKMRKRLEERLHSKSSSFEKRMEAFSERMEKFGDGLTDKMDGILSGDIKVGKGTKIIIDGVDVTDKYRKKSTTTTKSVKITTRQVRALFNLVMVGAMIILSIFVISILSGILNDVKYKNKSLDSKPKTTVEQPAEPKTSGSEKRL